MKKLLIAVTLSAAALSAQAAQSIKAEVNGMVCAFCAQGIEKKMKAQASTKNVYVDLKKKVVAVELKDGQTMDLDKFKAEIKDAGYDVVKAELVPQTAAQIKASLK
ncbi:MAG: heavy-metal-associated domain-containing protein [Burkholderiaceae bacterium]